MEPRLVVGTEGPDFQVEADRDPLKRALINLVKNAAASPDCTTAG